MPTPASEAYTPLISLAVHELRTPIGVVSGYLRMMLRDTDEVLTPRQRKMVEEADRSCFRLTAMIAELSDVGKLDAGTIRLASQPVDLMAPARGCRRPGPRGQRSRRAPDFADRCGLRNRGRRCRAPAHGVRRGLSFGASRETRAGDGRRRLPARKRGRQGLSRCRRRGRAAARRGVRSAPAVRFPRRAEAWGWPFRSRGV